MSQLAQTCAITDLDQAVDDALARHGADPTRLLQILISNAGTSRLAAAARRHAHRRGARPVARARRGRRRLLQFPLCAPRRAVSRAVRGQYRRRDAGRSGVDAAPLRKAVDRARQSLRGRAGQRGRDLLHRHGRPGAVRLGERRDDHRPGREAHRRLRRVDPRSGFARVLAEGVFRRRRQYSPSRHSAEATSSRRAKRCAARSRSAATRCLRK